MSALTVALNRTSEALNEATHKLDALAAVIAEAEAERKTLEKNLSEIRNSDPRSGRPAVLSSHDLMLALIKQQDIASEAIIRFGSV